jgi:HD-GYP domain-containing protein (c-di-GMP phosphodiesterase class II)
MRRFDAGTERRLREAIARRAGGPGAREVLRAAPFGIAFATAALALALLAPAERAFDPLLAGAFVVAYALAARVDFASGAGFATPTQLLVFPMLLLLPTPIVPMLVAVALVLAATTGSSRHGYRGRRAVLAVPDAWFAVGPAAVLCHLGVQSPAWSHWQAFALALLAQFAVDGIASTARARACAGVRLREALREMVFVYRVDVLLAPIGVLAAVAAASVPATGLLVLPLIVLIGVFAREREHRIAQTLELSGAYRGTALLLRDVLEEDDEYTGRHTEDVVGLSVQVAEQMRVDEEVRRATELGALLHDIGKIAIPDAIINKPGSLDADEWALMKTHTVEGQRMLDRVGGLLADVGVVVRASHERWDGTGYPDGLAGRKIPMAARIVSACDAYNAMTTDRSYRKALPLDVAARELRANAGTQFDPAVVEALLEVVGPPPAALDWQLALSPAAAAPAPDPSPLPARSGQPPAR